MKHRGMKELMKRGWQEGVDYRRNVILHSMSRLICQNRYVGSGGGIEYAAAHRLVSAERSTGVTCLSLSGGRLGDAL